MITKIPTKKKLKKTFTHNKKMVHANHPKKNKIKFLGYYLATVNVDE